MANVSLLATVADQAQSQTAGVIAPVMPTGAILSYAGSAAPTGWLVCDGADLSTTTYASLHAVIGYTFGGSGATFKLPDLRGRFVRYDDNMGNQGIAGVTAGGAAGRDTSRVHGSAQDQATKRPTINFTTGGGTISGTVDGLRYRALGYGYAAGSNSTRWNDDYTTAYNASVVSGSASSQTVNAGGDAETRPINIALNAIIKI